jgi:ribosomal-protein-alanine N-acetyltransferase
MKFLSTDRLYLRTWRKDDFQFAQTLWGDPEVMTFLGGPLTDDKVKDRLRAEMACYDLHGLQYWPIFEKETDAFVGCCGLRPWAYTPPDGYELGFHLMKSKWRRGYAFEVADAVLRYAFDQRRFSILRAGHHPEHVNSRKVLLKLGFQPVDHVFYPPTGLMHPTYQLRAECTAHRLQGPTC